MSNTVRKVQVAWFDVKNDLDDYTYEPIETWEIDSYQDIDQVMDRYLSDSKEHEDVEMSDLEKKRLEDFVTYLKHISN